MLSDLLMVINGPNISANDRRSGYKSKNMEQGKKNRKIALSLATGNNNERVPYWHN